MLINLSLYVRNMFPFCAALHDWRPDSDIHVAPLYCTVACEKRRAVATACYSPVSSMIPSGFPQFWRSLLHQRVILLHIMMLTVLVATPICQYLKKSNCRTYHFIIVIYAYQCHTMVRVCWWTPPCDLEVKIKMVSQCKSTLKIKGEREEMTGDNGTVLWHYSTAYFQPWNSVFLSE